MVELTVDLLEKATFLAGEKLSCRITFRNTSETQSETVAWASAQIHCQCLYREELVKTPLDTLQSPANDTAFVPNKGEKGRTLVATDAVVLLCDLVLGPGASRSCEPLIQGKVTSKLFGETLATGFLQVTKKSVEAITADNQDIRALLVGEFKQKKKNYPSYNCIIWQCENTYTEQIPENGPPSWSGRLVRYSYKLTVGAQRLSGTVQMLRIPFTVLKLPGSFQQPEASQSPLNLNPFHVVDKDNANSMEEALQRLAADMSKKASLTYTLKNRHGVVGKLLLFRHLYRLGDSVVVSFDFTSAAVKCLQLCVTLQSCETVPEQYSINRKHHSHCHTHGSQYEYCSHVNKLHVSLPIPPQCTHTFQSELVTLEWQLHFEFITSPSSSDGTSDSVETMTWTLPITVVTADPMQLLHDTFPCTQLITL